MTPLSTGALLRARPFLCPAALRPVVQDTAVSETMTPYVAPLCPAGHLPRKGGDQPAARLSPNANIAGRALRSTLPISPLAGEMSGRTEGGSVPPTFPTLPSAARSQTEGTLF